MICGVCTGSLQIHHRLTPAQQQLVQHLNADCASFDKVAPLDEANVLALSSPTSDRHHVLLVTADQLQAYGQAWWTGSECQVAIAVAPTCRRKGLASRIIATVEESAHQWGCAPKRAWLRAPRLVAQGWAHGNSAAAQAFAAGCGASPVRTLLKMRCPGLQVAPPVWPTGVVQATFDPDVHTQDVLAVNAAAFADHPEQGSWTTEDMASRRGEAWFDASDVLLARDADNGDLLGFHWTKVIPQRLGPPTGEVYVVAVAPAAQGRSVGRALVVAGLVHLADRGAQVADLFVEQDNAAAVRLYESLGFATVEEHVMYRRGG